MAGADVEPLKKSHKVRPWSEEQRQEKRYAVITAFFQPPPSTAGVSCVWMVVRGGRPPLS